MIQQPSDFTPPVILSLCLSIVALFVSGLTFFLGPVEKN
jgi:hypothetical protein